MVYITTEAYLKKKIWNFEDLKNIYACKTDDKYFFIPKSLNYVSLSHFLVIYLDFIFRLQWKWDENDTNNFFHCIVVCYTCLFHIV